MTPKPKELKRIEAEARQREHDARTPEQQLALIATRPGHSAGEVERLQRKARDLTTEAILNAGKPAKKRKRA